MSPTPHILLVDDDKPLSTVVKEYLEGQGYRCSLCHNAMTAIKILKSEKPDLCLFDIKMPMKDGFELAEVVQRDHPKLPFIFLTGQISVDDRVRGLEAGAEDYILKPFSMRELHLRIKNVLRHKQHHLNQIESSTSSTRHIGLFEFIPIKRKLIHKEQTVSLTDIEVKLLRLFLSSPDGILIRNNALREIWDDEHAFKQRSLNVYISRLRKYLELDQKIELKNIHGKGYQLIIHD